MEFKDIIKLLDNRGVSLYAGTPPRCDGYISFYTPAGEDFGFAIEANTPVEFVEEFSKYADEFDTEEHVKMWLDAKDSGITGVPDLKTLVVDADSIKEFLEEISSALKEESKK